MIAEINIKQGNNLLLKAVTHQNEMELYPFVICRLEESEYGFVVAECFGCDTNKELKMLHLQLQAKPGIVEVAQNPGLSGKPN